MKNSSFKFAFASTVLLSPLLGGCAVAVVGGMAAAGGVGYTAAQERGVNGTYDDMSVQAQINNTLNSRYGNITATVYGGQALLTGVEPRPRSTRNRPDKSPAETRR